MTPLQETIDSNRQLGLNKSKTNSQLKEQLPIDTGMADGLITEYGYLIEPNYIKWFYKQLYRVGVAAFIEAAVRAKEGRDPKRLFAKLLKVL